MVSSRPNGPKSKVLWFGPMINVLWVFYAFKGYNQSVERIVHINLSWWSYCLKFLQLRSIKPNCPALRKWPFFEEFKIWGNRMFPNGDPKMVNVLDIRALYQAFKQQTRPPSGPESEPWVFGLVGKRFTTAPPASCSSAQHENPLFPIVFHGMTSARNTLYFLT